MAKLGLPFQGKIWYYIEDSYGGGPTDSALPISVKVLAARAGLADKHKALRGFDKPEADILLEQPNDFTFHLEYIPQCGDTLLDDAMTRTSCALNSLCFFLETNSCGSVDKTYYLITGAKCKSTRFSSSHGTEYVYVMDFSVKETEPSDEYPSDVSSGDEPSELSGAICAFNIAGSIADGSGALAYILNAIDITLSNGIKDHWDHDSLDKQFAIEGEVAVDGSVDISLDEGGGVHLQDVLNQNNFTITINLGGSGCPKIILPNCKWKSSEIGEDNAGDIMKESAPFTGTTFTIGNV